MSGDCLDCYHRRDEHGPGYLLSPCRRMVGYGCDGLDYCNCSGYRGQATPLGWCSFLKQAIVFDRRGSVVVYPHGQYLPWGYHGEFGFDEQLFAEPMRPLAEWGPSPLQKVLDDYWLSMTLWGNYSVGLLRRA